MRIALIGDIHANLPALESVLVHAHQHGAQVLWNIGDFVGYGPFPDQVVRRIRADGILSVLGNYDEKVLNYQRNGVKTHNPQKALAFDWADKHLSPRARTYLARLPQQLRFDAQGWSVLLCHGSPASIKEHLMPDTPMERLDELAKIAHARIIVCGHSHRPFARQAGEALFINTGSVGRPEDGDPRACYALLDLSPDGLNVEHHRVEYDVERTVQAIRAAALPEIFAQMFLKARSLDSLNASTK
jgi:putative phosphoesterase